MDQAIKLQDATKKPVYPIRFADYGVNMISSGIIVNTETLKTKPDMVKFMSEKVSPAMAEIFGKKPYDPATNEGFGCGGCHKMNK